MRLFTSDTNWLVPTEHSSWSHVFYFRPSKVNSYKTTLHTLCVKLVYEIVYDLSSICDNLKTLNKVCYGFQHILATWCIHWSYPFNQLCTEMGHHFSYLIWATIWRMNPLFTSGICDNLFTKHSTHISKPLVFYFFKLDVLIYLNLKSSRKV